MNYKTCLFLLIFQSTKKRFIRLPLYSTVFFTSYVIIEPYLITRMENGASFGSEGVMGLNMIFDNGN